MGTQEFQPFYKTVMVAIKTAEPNQMSCLAGLIKTTDIPDGALESILIVWRTRCVELRKKYGLYHDDMGVSNQLTERMKKANEATGLHYSERH